MYNIFCNIRNISDSNYYFVLFISILLSFSLTSFSLIFYWKGYTYFDRKCVVERYNDIFIPLWCERWWLLWTKAGYQEMKTYTLNIVFLFVNFLKECKDFCVGMDINLFHFRCLSFFFEIIQLQKVDIWFTLISHNQGDLINIFVMLRCSVHHEDFNDVYQNLTFITALSLFLQH